MSTKTAALLVKDVRDASRDRYINLADAIQLYKEGKLVELVGLDSTHRAFQAKKA